MTPEGKVKQKVREYLTSIGAYYFMPVQTGMGAPTLDFLCSYKGRFFAIETKAARRALTPRQIATIEQIEKSGGRVFVINETRESYGPLIAWATRVLAISELEKGDGSRR